MAGTPTTNYQLPTYADTDAPDLTAEYNQAMTKIDTQLKSNADAASTNASAISTLKGRVDQLATGSFEPADDDATLTVQQLSEAKVTKSGIVYFKAAS